MRSASGDWAEVAAGSARRITIAAMVHLKVDTTVETSMYVVSGFSRIRVCASDNIGIQLVVVRPQPFLNVVEKFLRIPPRPPDPVHHTGVEHVLRVVSLSDAIDRAVVERLHDVVLSLQIHAVEYRTVAGNDLRVRVAQSEQSIERVDPTA